MAIFRPKESSGSNFYGVCKFAILGFEDKSSEFDWADLYLNVEIKQEGSDYTKELRITGNLEKDAKGNITGGSALKRLYHFFDVIGDEAGLNVRGEWENAEGEKIHDIVKYLNAGHAQDIIPDTEPEFNYLAYIYKEKPKVKGGKVYSRVFNKIQRDNDEGRKKLDADVKWFKSKGFIKEASESDTETPQQTVEMSGTGIGNL